jgi:hypothetical protein
MHPKQEARKYEDAVEIVGKKNVMLLDENRDSAQNSCSGIGSIAGEKRRGLRRTPLSISIRKTTR